MWRLEGLDLCAGLMGVLTGLARCRNPFNDDIVASGSDDAKIFIWKVPKDFTLHHDTEEMPDVSPVAKLSGHSR